MPVTPPGLTTPYYLYGSVLLVNAAGTPQASTTFTITAIDGTALVPRDAVTLAEVTPTSSADGVVPPYLLLGGAPTVLYVNGGYSQDVACREGVGPGDLNTLSATVAADVADLQGQIDVIGTPGIDEQKLASLSDALSALQATVLAQQAEIDALSPPTAAQVSWVQMSFTSGGGGGGGTPTFSFPGYPGDGYCYFGTIPLPSAASPYAGYSTDYYDRLIYSTDGLSTPTNHHKLIRKYVNLPLSSSLVTNLQANATAGLILVISVHNGAWTNAQILAGAADTDIDAAGNALKGMKGPDGVTPAPVWVTWYHEPENFSSAADQLAFRQATRYVIARWKALSAANLAYGEPFYIMVQDAVGKDYRVWNAEWNDAGTDWLKNADGTRVKIFDWRGIDYYRPFCQTGSKPFVSTDRNKEWSDQFTGQLVKTMKDTGARQLPWVIGELGDYTFPADNQHLGDDGVTASRLWSDMIEIGVATQYLMGVCIWSSNVTRFDAANDSPNVAGDAFGEKTTAWRAVAAGKVLRDTAGAVTTAATPRANYRWTAAATNRVKAI